MRLLIALAIAFAAAGFAQDGGTPNPPPVQAKRLPPKKGKPGGLIDQYNFGDQLSALQDTGGPRTPAPGASSAPATSIVPPDFKPRTDVQLSKTAQDAVQMSEKWMSERNQPSSGQDGRVLYSYGAGLPTMVCAPLRVCIIELQPGEKIVGEPQIGDSVRWNLSPAMYGTGELATPVIVLKPQAAGLDTNLLITTDRRAYYLRLLSKPDDYVARVAFAYPEDDENERKWREQLAAQRDQAKRASQSAELPRDAADALNFNYAVKGGDEALRPVRVFDDGKKTYIQISPEAKNREAPVLVVIGADGKQEMVNYRVKDGMYIVDRLFERARIDSGQRQKGPKGGDRP